MLAPVDGAAMAYAQGRPMPKRTVAVRSPTRNLSGTHAEREPQVEASMYA